MLTFLYQKEGLKCRICDVSIIKVKIYRLKAWGMPHRDEDTESHNSLLYLWVK